MSFVGNMLGMGSSPGAQGLNYQAQSSNILQPTNVADVQAAQNQSNSALAQQQAFTSALGSQNGISNQANVFNQQQALANQLGGIANGTGPNPALQQFQNATGANMAAQNAMMAGQRGANANVGLMARQAAMQGGNLQQQAVGQGTALQMQQQLNATNALQSQQANMANLAGNQIGQQAGAYGALNAASQGQQNSLLGALGNYNNASVGMQGNMNNANEGIAQTNAKNQTGMMANLPGAASIMLAKGGEIPSRTPVQHFDFGGSVNAVQSTGPQSFVGQYLQSPQIAPAASAGNAAGPDNSEDPMSKQSQQLMQGLAKKYGSSAKSSSSGMDSGVAGAGDVSGGASDLGDFGGVAEAGDVSGGASDLGDFGSMLGANGGSVPSYDDGGDVQDPQGPSSSGAGKEIASLIPMLVALLSKGGKIPIDGEMLAAKGDKVPGQAKVKGDSLKNDKVKALLSPGEVVIPRSVMQSSDPVQNSAKFVASILAKKRKG